MIRTQEDLDRIQAAFKVLDDCEEIHVQAESENYHSLMGSLEDMVTSLHVHNYTVRDEDESEYLCCSYPHCYTCITEDEA